MPTVCQALSTWSQTERSPLCHPRAHHLGPSSREWYRAMLLGISVSYVSHQTVRSTDQVLEQEHGAYLPGSWPYLFPSLRLWELKQVLQYLLALMPSRSTSEVCPCSQEPFLTSISIPGLLLKWKGGNINVRTWARSSISHLGDNLDIHFPESLSLSEHQKRSLHKSQKVAG